MVKLLACGARGPGFDSLSRRYDFRDCFLAYRIGESMDLPVHGKPYLSPHHSEPLECLPTQYTGEEFRLSPRCMDDFRFSDVT